VIEIEPVRAWGAHERELPEWVAAAVAATGVVKVIPVRPPSLWRIEADSRIGILVGDGWELRIQPHIEIPKLMFLLTYSLTPEGWEGVLTGMRGERDLAQALAASFCMHTERIVRQGLLRGYVEVEERRSDLRGRVRFGDQLARLAGLAIPLEVTYDEFTPDVTENRLLRAATETLLRMPRVTLGAHARLGRLRGALDQVSVLHWPRRAALPAPTRINQHYRPALVLAKLILEGNSLSQDRGGASARSFLFDMNEVFESFLYMALRDSMRQYGGALEAQVTGALDRAPTPGLPLCADIVWRKHDCVRAVIDSKYKPIRSHLDSPNQDAYQMLAYCVAFGVRRGVLVYAHEGDGQSAVHELKRHGYEIELRSIGVEQEPPALLAEVARMAADIAAREHDTLVA
jgi:5-methylcytosine-specific restriction enzyme subunit McrC